MNEVGDHKMGLELLKEAARKPRSHWQRVAGTLGIAFAVHFVQTAASETSENLPAAHAVHTI